MAPISEQTIVTLTKFLDNFSLLLRKGEAFADEKGIPHEKVITYRLVEDQRDMTYQVQSVSNTIKKWLVRFGALEDVTIPDEEKTFAELHARIELAKSHLAQADKAALDAHETKEVILPGGKFGDFYFKDGQTYVSEFVIPNFHFHLCTGYCILRAQGVDVGAFDYLNGVLIKKE